MSASDFLDISAGTPGFRTEQLFRGAISAFSALTRPSRSEANQLEDLVMPLLPLVSQAALRFASAALSDMRAAPAGLVRRLADLPVAVSAPLLVRSPVLTDIDFITLIGRHGLPHALVIARRPDLNPDITEVIQALARIGRSAAHIAESVAPADTAPVQSAAGGETAADTVRDELRGMMRPASTAPISGEKLDWERAASAYPNLLSTAATGRRALFQTAIADAFGLDFATASKMVDAVDGRLLVTAFRALDLTPEQAFTLFALIYPGVFNSTEIIAGFLDRYRDADTEAARERIASLARRNTLLQRRDGRQAANDAASDRKSLTA